MQDAEAIQHLEQSDQYRVIQRLHAPDRYCQGKPATPRIGIVIDTETTGLDANTDSIIELGFVAFSYDAGSGLIYDILHTYDAFEDPGKPLSDIVKQITGITDAMVAGQHLDDADANAWLEKADLIIAHNAAFDRQMLERRLPIVCKANWACTFNDIPWQDEDISSLKLDYIAYKMGYFFDGHRAVNDAQATLHLLTKPLPCSRKLTMITLLSNARASSHRFFAIRAPFDKKDDLKARGYRWMPDFVHNGKKGVWSKSVADSEASAEAQWLTDSIYTGKPLQFMEKKVLATDRYSNREFTAE